MPRRPGVYLIHDMRGVLYVGRADSLRRRFEEHLAWSHNGDVRAALRSPVGVLHFTWSLADSLEQLELERELIRALRPLCNVQHNVAADVCTGTR